jgi:hypothetical protein
VGDDPLDADGQARQARSLARSFLLVCIGSSACRPSSSSTTRLLPPENVVSHLTFPTTISLPTPSLHQFIHLVAHWNSLACISPPQASVSFVAHIHFVPCLLQAEEYHRGPGLLSLSTFVSPALASCDLRQHPHHVWIRREAGFCIVLFTSLATFLLDHSQIFVA